MTSGRFRQHPEYEVLDELGRGGMGVVFRARQRSTGRLVALKIVWGALTAKRRERFLREGQTTAALFHPGIVRVHAIGELDGNPFLAYELLADCRSLTEEAAQRDLAGRVALVRDAALALGHAHAQGVVHRDVKPDNLLVDGDGVVKVADFGLALAEGVDRLTRTGELLGTPHYMPPEAYDGSKQTGPEADVWALGVILFEVLADELPFQGQQMVDIAAAVTSRRAPTLRSVAPHVPRVVAAICARALEPAARDRYIDAHALAVDLDAFLEGTPPPGLQRSSRLPLMLGGLIAVLLVVLGITLGVELVRRSRSVAADPAPALATGRAVPRPARLDPVAEARRSLLAGRHQHALSILARVRSPEARRLRGLAALLLGRRLQAQRELKTSTGVRLLDLDRARQALLDASVISTAEGAKPVLRGIGSPLVLRVRSEELLELAELVLPTWAELRPLIAGPVQDALVAAIVVNLRFGEVPNARQLLDICARTIALAPDLPSAHRCRLARAWVYFTADRSTRFPSHPRLKENLIADPASWAEALTEEMRFAAHGMWFFTSPTVERLRSAKICVEMSHPPGYASGYLRRMNLILLCRLYRQRAGAALDAGRRAEAEAALETAFRYGRQNLNSASEELVPNDLDHTELALTELVAGRPTKARRLAAAVKMPEARDTVLGEIDLFEGKYQAAIDRVQPYGRSDNLILQAVFVGIHAQALNGERAAARRALARVLAWSRTNAYREVKVEWRTPDSMTALIAGSGWWPGKKR